MAREFTLGGANLTVVAATTVLFINPAAAPNFNIEVLRMWLSQSANATSAQQRIQIETQVTSFPTLVSATPAKLKRADPNASIITGNTTGAAGTSGINASGEGAGGKTVIFEDNFNVLNGWLYVPTPVETIVMPAGSASGLGMFWAAGPTTLTGWTVGMNFREV